MRSILVAPWSSLSILLNLLESGALICLAKPLLLLEGEPRSLPCTRGRPKKGKRQLQSDASSISLWLTDHLLDDSRLQLTVLPPLNYDPFIPFLPKRKTKACRSYQLATLSGTRQSEPKGEQSHRYCGFTGNPVSPTIVCESSTGLQPASTACIYS